MILAELAKTGDGLSTLQRYRLEDPSGTRLLLMSLFLKRLPVAGSVDPGALDAIRNLRSEGLTVILSDDDVIFPPRKDDPGGLWNGVNGRVRIYLH